MRHGPSSSRQPPSGNNVSPLHSRIRRFKQMRRASAELGWHLSPVCRAHTVAMPDWQSTARPATQTRWHTRALTDSSANRPQINGPNNSGCAKFTPFPFYRCRFFPRFSFSPEFICRVDKPVSRGPLEPFPFKKTTPYLRRCEIQIRNGFEPRNCFGPSQPLLLTVNCSWSPFFGGVIAIVCALNCV